MRSAPLALWLVVGCSPPDTSSVPSTTTTENTSNTSTPPGTTTTPTTPALSDAAKAAIAEAVDADLNVNAATGASVAIWYDGALVYAEGFGTKHPELEDPVTPDTVFQIGSDTKKITAIAVLQAVERGDLALDDTVAGTIPDLALAKSPGWAEQATVHDLLSHQGGLFDYTPWENDPDDAALGTRARGEFADGEYAMAPPGAFWNYANPNYAIAGLAAEEATGRPYADIVEDDVFAPLGMTSSFARKSEVPEGRWATGTGYTLTTGNPFDPWSGIDSYTFGTVEHADESDNAFTRPAGLVWSTASDMARLAAFLLDGDPAVLSDDLRTEITASQVAQYPSIPEFGGYGYGMFVYDGFQLGTEFYDVPLWAHGGNTLTMSSLFYVLPEQRFAISILSNGYADNFSATASAAMLAVAGLPAPGTPTVLPGADRDAFLGEWADPFGVGNLAVSVDPSDAIQVSAPTLEAMGLAHGSLDLVATDLATMTIASVPYELVWIAGPDGPGQWVRNRLFVGERGTIVPPPGALRASGFPSPLAQLPRSTSRFPAP